MVASKIGDIKGVFLSIAKAAPVLAGAAAGIFLPPEKGWTSVWDCLTKEQNPEAALQSLAASYTFYNYQKPGLSSSAGTGVKTLVAGGFVSKAIDWLIG